MRFLMNCLNWLGLMKMSDVFEQKKEMYKVALENRKLELSIVWTRLAFFTAIIYMLFEAVTTKGISADTKKLLAYAGCIVSISFGLSCIALKFWINNWEKKIDLLEKDLSYYIDNETLTKANVENGWKRYFHPSITWHQCMLAVCSFLYFLHMAGVDVFGFILKLNEGLFIAGIFIFFVLFEGAHYVLFKKREWFNIYLLCACAFYALFILFMFAINCCDKLC